MSLSRYQLERADLTVILEQGRRVEGDLYAENHRTMQTMGELLKARVFGSTPWAVGLRKRMTNYVRGGGKTDVAPGASVGGITTRQAQGRDSHRSLRSHLPEPHRGRKVSLPQKAPRGTEGRPGFDSQRLHPDLDAEEAWHPSHLNLVVEPLIGRLKVPARYRKDESDR